MAHFYGRLQGRAGEATRCGSKSSGLQTYAETWDSRIVVDLRQLGQSGTLAQIALSGKYGGTTALFAFDPDLIYRHADAPGVRQCLDRAERAMSAAQLAAERAAERAAKAEARFEPLPYDAEAAVAPEGGTDVRSA